MLSRKLTFDNYLLALINYQRYSLYRRKLMFMHVNCINSHKYYTTSLRMGLGS